MHVSSYRRFALLGAALVCGASAVLAQQPASPPPGGPAVGESAPEFTAAGATRFGTLREPVKLADYRGRTVVLAFFPKARTKG